MSADQKIIMLDARSGSEHRILSTWWLAVGSAEVAGSWGGNPRGVRTLACWLIVLWSSVATLACSGPQPRWESTMQERIAGLLEDPPGPVPKLPALVGKMEPVNPRLPEFDRVIVDVTLSRKRESLFIHVQNLSRKVAQIEPSSAGGIVSIDGNLMTLRWVPNGKEMGASTYLGPRQAQLYEFPLTPCLGGHPSMVNGGRLVVPPSFYAGEFAIEVLVGFGFLIPKAEPQWGPAGVAYDRYQRLLR